MPPGPPRWPPHGGAAVRPAPPGPLAGPPSCARPPGPHTRGSRPSHPEAGCARHRCRKQTAERPTSLTTRTGTKMAWLYARESPSLSLCGSLTGMVVALAPDMKPRCRPGRRPAKFEASVSRLARRRVWQQHRQLGPHIGRQREASGRPAIEPEFDVGRHATCSCHAKGQSKPPRSAIHVDGRRCPGRCDSGCPLRHRDASVTLRRRRRPG